MTQFWFLMSHLIDRAQQDPPPALLLVRPVLIELWSIINNWCMFRCGRGGGSDLWGIRSCCGWPDQQRLSPGNDTLIHKHTHTNTHWYKLIHKHTHIIHNDTNTQKLFLLLLFLFLLLVLWWSSWWTKVKLYSISCWNKVSLKEQSNISLGILRQVLRTGESPQLRVMSSAVMKTRTRPLS